MRKILTISLLAVLALSAAIAAAGAQENVRRVAILGPAEEPRFSNISSALKRGLRDHGYVERVLKFIEGKVSRGDFGAARAAVQHALQEHAEVDP